MARVWHEIVSDDLHIDLHEVLPTPERPFHALVTSGMSARPMTAPAEFERFRYAEVLALLPPTWSISTEAFKEEANFWPVRLLKMLARYPHKAGTWLGYGHSIANEGNPPAPFAPTTKQNAVMLLPSLSLPSESWILETAGAPPIQFWTAFPLYWEELQLKIRKGSDALLEALEKAEVGDIIDPRRVNVATRRFLGRF